MAFRFKDNDFDVGICMNVNSNETWKIEPYVKELLYPETKELLSGIPEYKWVQVLSNAVRMRSYSVVKQNVSNFKTDLILLLGYSHGEFGISTSRTNIFKEGPSSAFRMVTNRNGYGLNELLLSSDVDYYEGKKQINCHSKYFNYKAKVTDTYIRVSRFLESYWLKKDTGSLGVRTIKSKCYHIFYFFEDGKVKISLNKLKLYSLPKEIRDDHDFYNLLLDTLESSGVKQNYNVLRKSNFKAGLRAIRNPLWRDLNIPIDSRRNVENLHVKYATLKYHYDKYGTSGLRAKFIGTPNRLLQRFLSEDYDRILKYHKLKKAKLDHHFDPHNLIELFNNNMLCERSIDVIGILLNHGFSVRKIVNCTDKYNFADISTLYFSVTRLLDDETMHLLNDVMNPKHSIRQVHDDLAILQRVRRDVNYLREIPLQDYAKTLGYETEDYLFVPAAHTRDLLELGTKLNICVASYDSFAINGECTIVGVYCSHTKTPIACIEIRNSSKTVVQAKLSRNQSVCHDEKVLKSVIEWIDANTLTHRTRDLTIVPSDKDTPF